MLPPKSGRNWSRGGLLFFGFLGFRKASPLDQTRVCLSKLLKQNLHGGHVTEDMVQIEQNEMVTVAQAKDIRPERNLRAKLEASDASGILSGEGTFRILPV